MAMGFNTNAKGKSSLAMGKGAEATEDESLVSSGNIHGKNMFIHADERLVANTATASPTRMLSAICQLRVVEYGAAPSSAMDAHVMARENARVRVVARDMILA